MTSSETLRNQAHAIVAAWPVPSAASTAALVRRIRELRAHRESAESAESGERERARQLRARAQAAAERFTVGDLTIRELQRELRLLDREGGLG